MDIAEINWESLAAWRAQGIATTILRTRSTGGIVYGSGDALRSPCPPSTFLG